MRGLVVLVTSKTGILNAVYVYADDGADDYVANTINRIIRYLKLYRCPITKKQVVEDVHYADTAGRDSYYDIGDYYVTVVGCC